MPGNDGTRSTDSPAGDAGRSLRADARGVSPVVGAVLMLAVAMLLLSVLQTTAIPALNAQQEFQHNQDLQTDLVELETTVDRVAAIGTGETTPVAVGLRYPPRLVFVNPPPVSGRLRTTDPRNATIANARAPGETGDYWDGTTRRIPTRTVVYSPAYNEYGDAPTTVYEPWVVYNRQDDASVPLTGTDLVDGRRISLVAIDGEYSASRAGTVGVNAEPESAPVRVVTVRNDTGPVTLTVPTGLRNDTWTRLLEAELAANGGNVTGIDCADEPPAPCGELTLTLSPGSYDLHLGEVALDGSDREPATYLTDVEGNATAVPESGRQRLAVEARDRFDNPVSGVPVAASVADGPGEVDRVRPTSGPDGRAVFVYRAPDDVAESQSVTVTARFGDGAEQRTVDFDVRVVDLDPGTGPPPGPGPGPPPGTSADAVAGVEESVDSGNVPGRDRGREITFDLRATEAVTVTDFSVQTRGDLAGRPFVDRGTTFDGSEPRVTFQGEVGVVLREFGGSGNLGVEEFVDPSDEDAVVVVTLQFDDGSTRTLGIA
ncbi:type IV pilin [Natronomonas marina]|uniref:type IV pilin n=1 Tax=Natronomonas marina TaxID=2961939 RepID=UPI0020C96273|nr:type IV pilin [Natronomonas marina]